MKAWHFWTAALLIWLIGGYFVGGASYFIDLPAWLLVVFGWMRFLVDNVPRMTADPLAVIIGGVAAVLFVVVAHFLIRSLVRSRPAVESNGAASPPLPWKLRWSLALLAIVVVMFVAGISLVGIAHQTAWLATSQVPIYEKVLGGWYGGSHPSQYSNKLKMVGMSIHTYHDVYRELPEGENSRHARGLHSWETLIAPYSVWYLEGIDLTKPWNEGENASRFTALIPDYINPLYTTDTWHNAEGYGLSHYSANDHVLGPKGVGKLDDITDGTANTLLIGEVAANFEPWGKPGNWRDPTLGLNRSPHGFGCPRRSHEVYFVMADGSIRALRDNIDPEVLHALATPAGKD